MLIQKGTEQHCTECGRVYVNEDLHMCASDDCPSQTISSFAEACRALSSDEIYELFEGEINDDLRTSIMETYANDSIEPVRYALNSMGRSYSVQSLIDY